jgi:hypothetical protein
MRSYPLVYQIHRLDSVLCETCSQDLKIDVPKACECGNVEVVKLLNPITQEIHPYVRIHRNVEQVQTQDREGNWVPFIDAMEFGGEEATGDLLPADLMQELWDKGTHFDAYKARERTQRVTRLLVPSDYLAVLLGIPEGNVIVQAEPVSGHYPPLISLTVEGPNCPLMPEHTTPMNQFVNQPKHIAKAFVDDEPEDKEPEDDGKAD